MNRSHSPRPVQAELAQSYPVVDLLMPEQVQAATGRSMSRPVPVLEMPLADQRKWCVAPLRWLDGETPTCCPTGDLYPDGGCRRSPARRPCLLLLPGDHPDWVQARRWVYRSNGIYLRQDPAPINPRPPLTLSELG